MSFLETADMFLTVQVTIGCVPSLEKCYYDKTVFNIFVYFKGITVKDILSMSVDCF